MSKTVTSRLLSSLLVGAVFVALGLGALAVFVKVAEPTPRKPHIEFKENYSETMLLDALKSNGVEKRLVEIASNGSRLSGSPGFYKVEQYIADQFLAAGLEVSWPGAARPMRQEFSLVVPVTEFCEILDEAGQPLPDVKLYPFQPNGLLPTALAEQGISGTLVATESADLKKLGGMRADKSIVLTYLDAAANWGALASAGVPALIVREDELYTSAKANPDERGPWHTMTSFDEHAFPRFLARGPIEKYAGKPVTIKCKVTWQEKTVRNVFGVLKAAQPRSEALVVTAFYDSSSLVPDLAPGAEQSVGLAAMLELVRALAPYRKSLERDVIFVATAGHAQSMSGVSRLMEAIEDFSRKREGFHSFEERRAEQTRFLQYATRALESQTIIDDKYNAWLDDQRKIVSGEINLVRRDEMLSRRLDYLRAGSPVYRPGFNFQTASDAERKDPTNSHPILLAYLDARAKENRSSNFMSMPWDELAKHPEFVEWNYAAAAAARFTQLKSWHERQIRELDDMIEVQRLFKPYERTLTINIELFTGGIAKRKDLAVLVGTIQPGNVVEPQVSELANALRDKTGGAMKVDHWSTRDAEGTLERPNRHGAGWLESVVWHLTGRQAFTITNLEFVPSKLATPEDTLDRMPMDALNAQMPIVGRALLAIAHGRVPLKKIEPDLRGNVVTISGNVYAAAGATSIVATHPMGQRTFVCPWTQPTRYLNTADTRGVAVVPILAADPYGVYQRKLFYSYSKNNVLSVDAARFADDGRVTWFKDDSPAAQSIFHSSAVPLMPMVATGWRAASPVQVTMFRCTPVSLFNQINPQTMKAFGGVKYFSTAGLVEPSRFYAGPITMFLEPDFQFYMGLRDGAAGNPEIQEYRAFMLNVDGTKPIGPDEPEIFGRGYLAADNSTLILPHFDGARSLLRTAEKRLTLMRQYGMTDRQMQSFHDQGRDWLTEADAKLASTQPAATTKPFGEVRPDTAGAVIDANTSFAYAINNHPVIRQRISDAVIGILWYLGWLVPFVFFAEKLLFGYADIRKQLLAVGIIFLIVFALLRIFHPAFEMVRAPIVILLGFVILLLTLLVTLMVGGKFKQNIRELRRREGRVEGADVNRGGVIGTAFMLGLNNMRRRKTRTALTCLTLILITFVMICFTSVSTDLSSEEHATGRSNWNGIMLRPDNYAPLNPAEVNSLNQIFGNRFPVMAHTWLTPSLVAQSLSRNVEILIDREFKNDKSLAPRRASVNSAVMMTWLEPQFSGIDKLLNTKKPWFDRPPQTRQERLDAKRTGYKAKNYVILPDNIARELAISARDVDEGEPAVTIRGEAFIVRGIIDSLELSKALGLDGKSILPFDLNTVQNLGSVNNRFIIPEDVGHFSGSQVILVNKLPSKQSTEEVITVNCSILFPKQPYQLAADEPPLPPVDYSQQRKVIAEFLERSGQPAYYAADGVSYYGSRKRERTLGGMLELLVPILIAALTVFNTMRGSVYERKDEIYVYNAVGIAPNHVFFIFMAEALVYAVVGAMLGYLLSQASGRLLTALGMTGGLNMDYSSIETIYASLAIMAAVLLSTILPARDAARLAAPSEPRSVDVQPLDSDVMEFVLPFTFTPHDRVAIVSYVSQWLDANGSGSSGPFYCSPPTPDLNDSEDDCPIPAISTIIWLKPYDLGVSQSLKISVPTDPETGEYIARVRLQRLSGHVASWKRALAPFLGVIRKQFLNWRVTSAEQRSEYFTEAKQMLQEVNENA